MRTLLGLMALLASAGCSTAVATPDTTHDTIMMTDGPLKLTVSDALATPGVMFIAGSVTGGSGMVTAASTRYGSLCSTAVAGHATVSPGAITLQVTYSDRQAVCTQEIRAISYRAEIGSLAPGTYTVKVVHTNGDGSSGAVLTQQVTVI